MKLLPIDDEQPRLGGKVTASVFSFDVRTFTPSYTKYFGAYGEDFLAFADFGNGTEPSEETLLKIFDNNHNDVVDKHLFKFEDNKLLYSRTVNGERKDAEIEHAISESELRPVITDTWTETLFYGVGNKNM